MNVLQLDARSLKAAPLSPPVSKSDAQRAQVLSRILGQPGLAALSGPPDGLPADVRTMARGLAALDAGGTGQEVELDCEDGGAPFRILLGQAAVAPGGTYRFTGTPRLWQRPHRPLFESLSKALSPHGTVFAHGEGWPLTVRASGRTGAPVFHIAGGQSSQFVSSLLLAAAALQQRERRAWTVSLLGPTASEGYLALTLQWLRAAGFSLREEGSDLVVADHREPSTLPLIPGDWSSLGYLVAIAWRTGGTVLRADPRAPHPDKAVLPLLASVGVRAEEVAPSQLQLAGKASRGLEVSAHPCPDLMPTLAALACVLPGPSRIADVGILRGKESDRLEGIRALVKAAGGETELSASEALTIRPPLQVSAALDLDSRGDHRLAMAGATLACLAGVRARITEPHCVAKSFPGFWRELQGTGVGLEFIPTATF